jgi:hypothetical protein
MRLACGNREPTGLFHAPDPANLSIRHLVVASQARSRLRILGGREEGT